MNITESNTESLIHDEKEDSTQGTSIQLYHNNDQSSAVSELKQRLETTEKIKRMMSIEIEKLKNSLKEIIYQKLLI